MTWSSRGWGRFVSALLLFLTGCATEYVGTARAPVLPLPAAPVERPVGATRTEAGVEFTLEEWAQAQRNLEALRAHVEMLRAIIEVYNQWARELRGDGE